MHELSLCRAIADTVLDNAGGRSVTRVSLQIGHLRQVVPDTLLYCWTLVVEGSELEGAALAIDHVPTVIECRHCGHVATLQAPVFRCTACAGTDVDVTSGDEFLITSIDILEAI